MGKFREILDPTFPSKDRNERNFHNKTTSGEWNDEHVEAAAEELQKPLMQIVKSARDSMAGVYLGTKNLVKDTVTGTLSLASNTVTGAIAAPFKFGRWALDLLKIPPVLLIASTGAVARTAGYPSKWMRKTNEKVHKIIGRPLDSSGASDDPDLGLAAAA